MLNNTLLSKAWLRAACCALAVMFSIYPNVSRAASATGTHTLTSGEARALHSAYQEIAPHNPNLAKVSVEIWDDPNTTTVALPRADFD